MKIRPFARVQWNTSVDSKELALDFDQPAEQRELVRSYLWIRSAGYARDAYGGENNLCRLVIELINKTGIYLPLNKRIV